MDTSTTGYSYDAGNRLVQIVDSLSGTITRIYGDLNRLTEETTLQGSVSFSCSNLPGRGRRLPTRGMRGSSWWVFPEAAPPPALPMTAWDAGSAKLSIA
ncbi:MAG: hypothetical protein KIT39_18180 [Nitrospirales bacterium]|nr:hypothetical protein [Nitrospirales bacterium]